MLESILSSFDSIFGLLPPTPCHQLNSRTYPPCGCWQDVHHVVVTPCVAIVSSILCRTCLVSWNRSTQRVILTRTPSVHNMNPTSMLIPCMSWDLIYEENEYSAITGHSKGRALLCVWPLVLSNYYYHNGRWKTWILYYYLAIGILVHIIARCLKK